MGTAVSSIFCPPSSETSAVASTTTAAKPYEPKATKRLFVAVELPEDERKLCLETIADKLLPLDKITEEGVDMTSVKWVLDPSLFHCTLQFLGSVDGDRVEDLSDQLREQIIHSIAPFNLQLGGLGCFPSHNSTEYASVVWLGLDGDTQELKDLAGVVMDATEPLGFRRERRPFSAHITLGRVRRKLPAALQEQMEKMMNYDEKEAESEIQKTQSFQVNHVALIESKLSNGRPEYIALERFHLRKSN